MVMTSAIDPTIPEAGQKLTALPVRANFSAAYSEITTLQQQVKILPQMLATRCGLNTAAQFPTNLPGCESRIQHCLPYGAESMYPIYSAFNVQIGGNGTELPEAGGFGYYANSAVPVAPGSGYAVGDVVVVTVPTNSFPVTLQVDAVTVGAVTALSIINGGGFAAVPGAGLATATSTGSGNNALTVTLGVKGCAMVARVGLEQSWGNQFSFASTALSGVLKTSIGFDEAGANGNLIVPQGQPISGDVVVCGLPAASLIGSRIYTPGTGFYVGRYLLGNTGLNEESSANVALSGANPWGNSTYPSRPDPAPGFQPIAIMGIPQVPGPDFLFLGDSIGYGTVSASGSTSHDTLDANGNAGYLERAINRVAPWANFATSGMQLATYLSQNFAPIRWELMQEIHPSHVVDQLGINDLVSGGVTFATFSAQKIKFWQMLRGLPGIKQIWATTMTPNTTSTDGWATVANQTVTAANTAIQAYNAALRAGTFNAYIDTVLDLGTSAESTVGSGKWPANGTGDGLHPSQSQTPIIAATIAPAFPTATL